MGRNCLNRFLGKCPKCAEDYDTTHHPNNLDCPDYHEINIQNLEVKSLQDGRNIEVYTTAL